MTIVYLDGDIFTTEADAIVDPCNCMGVQGGGLSKIFRDKFPEYSKQYRRACEKYMDTDELVVSATPENGFKYVIGAPTKFNFRYPSRIEFIEEACYSLATICNWLNIESINVPALGCGCGKMDFEEVKDVYKVYFHEHETRFNCFLPK